MNHLKRQIAVLFIGTVMAFVHLTGPAGASRADGVCGGVGTYDPVTQECVSP